MISDTLSDAVFEIERYQQEMPEVYDSIKPHLEDLKAHMTKVREYLDTPPGYPKPDLFSKT